MKDSEDIAKIRGTFSLNRPVHRRDREYRSTFVQIMIDQEEERANKRVKAVRGSNFSVRAAMDSYSLYFYEAQMVGYNAVL